MIHNSNHFIFLPDRFTVLKSTADLKGKENRDVILSALTCGGPPCSGRSEVTQGMFCSPPAWAQGPRGLLGNLLWRKHSYPDGETIDM